MPDAPVVAPIPVKVTRHLCPFCRRGHSRPCRARVHIASCWHNPAARGCLTCRHLLPGDSADCETGYPGFDESCGQGVDLFGRAACEQCGGQNFIPTGEVFRTHLAVPGPVMAQCPACKGDGAERKPGPIVHCPEWAPKVEEGESR